MTEPRLLRRLYVRWSTEGTYYVANTTYSFLRWRMQRLRWVNRIYLNDRSETDASKTKVVHVNPNTITEYITPRPLKYELMEFGAVYGGRWDQVVGEFRHRCMVESLRRHFEEGVDWSNTKYYQKALSEIEGGSWKDCATEDDLVGYFQWIDQLYTRIDEEGYKSQSALLTERPAETKVWNNDSPTPLLNEIGVHLGRNGQFIWGHRGQHRLCIAQLLGLRTVPVQVLTRHSGWQDVRDEVRTVGERSSPNSDRATNRNHPDLADVI